MNMTSFRTKAFRVTAGLTFAAAVLGALAVAPALAADPLGTWLTEDKQGKIRITDCGGALCGTLVWLAEPLDPDTRAPKTDKNNADVSKRNRPLVGITIVLNMKPSGANTWEGKVYNSRDGNTYSGSFTLTGANTADLKGCVMGGLMCKTENWTRSN
jgi:uncharacterized protein (DUF2147 family)